LFLFFFIFSYSYFSSLSILLNLCLTFCPFYVEELRDRGHLGRL